MHVIAAKAVCFKLAQSDEFIEYQKQIAANAQALAKGLLARNVQLVSGGTDNHLMLLDLRNAGISGKKLERLMDEAHITANKNAIPRDPKGPNITSGVRLGTPAVTTRGMKEAEMDEIADMIAKLVHEGEAAVEEVRARAIALTERFPLCEGEILE